MKMKEKQSRMSTGKMTKLTPGQHETVNENNTRYYEIWNTDYEEKSRVRI